MLVMVVVFVTVTNYRTPRLLSQNVWINQ